MGFSIKIVLDREIGSVMDILASKGNERLGAENTVHFCTELLQYRTEVLVNGSSERDYWEPPTPTEELQSFGFSQFEAEEIFFEIDQLLKKLLSAVGVVITPKSQLLYFNVIRHNSELCIWTP